jgi:hypothetical protein
MGDDASVGSGISNASSRSEHMAYMKEELGLDHPTASMLYRAERLQEKGQLKQALQYFNKVLANSPDCTEAVENARMVAEMIDGQKAPTLTSISETKPTGTEYTVVEMQVDWEDHASIQFGDYYPEPDRAAFRNAKIQLRKTGHGHSLLKLVKNEVLEDACNGETGWLTWLSGRATFQVTLIKDLPDDKRVPSTVEDVAAFLANLQADLEPPNALPTAPAQPIADVSTIATNPPTAEVLAPTPTASSTSSQAVEEFVAQPDGSFALRPPSPAWLTS